MKGYKGFGKNLSCKDKQYEENTVFEEKEAVICESGMHFCENPLDVLDFYPLLGDNGELNEFAEVEALDEPITNDNKKFATTKLKIGAKLSFKGFIGASINFLFEKNKGDIDSGYSAQLASSGYFAQLASSGYSAQLASSGYYAQLASSGEKSVVCGIGYRNIAKASKGSWITLAEYDTNGVVKSVKTEYVDGEKIKANIFYSLVDGEFKEVE